jgi:hypothetical protein
MTAQLALMVTPTRLDSNEEGPPQFYILRGSIWREVPLVASSIGRPIDVRNSIEEVLATIMAAAANPGAAAPWTALAAKFRQIWSAFVPELVQRQLAELLPTDDDPPLLLLYVHPSLEWIPWELLHDDSDHLGRRYVIARLPIVRRGPQSFAATRAVHRVCTFLGEHLMDDIQRAEWESTFSGVPAQVTVEQFPTNGVWPNADQVVKAATADILHITCHGGKEDRLFESVWTLNDQGDGWVYGLSRALVDTMPFTTPGPLVFGNACQGAAGAVSTAGLIPGLAYTFFDRGATAFVGAFAPISKPLALRFATAFYQHLLGEQLPIGTALWRTKRDFDPTVEKDPSSLFYCLYGPPDTVFVPAGP